MNPKSFFAELTRRNVYKVAIAERALVQPPIRLELVDASNLNSKRRQTGTAQTDPTPASRLSARQSLR
jgi:hypothetical protein